MKGVELIGGKIYYVSNAISQWLMGNTEMFSHFIFKYEVTTMNKSY